MNVCATNHSQFKRSSSRIFYFLFLSAALQATVFSFPFGTFLATRPRTTRHAPRVGSPPFHSLLVRRSCRRPAPARSPDLRPPARLSLSSRPAPGARAKLLLAVMRWRGGALLLLLLAAFFVVAVAEDTVSGETNGDSSKTESSVDISGKSDETDLTKEVIHEEGGLKNDTNGNNKKDNSTEETGGTRDEPLQQLRGKDSKATKSSQTTDFLQDPLIMECDPSHRCINEKNKFIACLKVPGEDSLALSLLMDNKGMNTLDVSITAPDYVTLAEDTVHIEANDHNETQVRVSIGDAANNTAIVLKVAEETCTINIHRAIAREAGPAMRMRLPSIYMMVPVFILLAVVGTCIKLRTHKQDGSLAYQKLDTTELPVSIGGKKESDQSDKWDDNWGDDWDDEEAPLTPSKPMANPSSKGLSARRLTKDGWKD